MPAARIVKPLGRERRKALVANRAVQLHLQSIGLAHPREIGVSHVDNVVEQLKASESVQCSVLDHARGVYGTVPIAELRLLGHLLASDGGDCGLEPEPPQQRELCTQRALDGQEVVAKCDAGDDLGQALDVSCAANADLDDVARVEDTPQGRSDAAHAHAKQVSFPICRQLHERDGWRWAAFVELGTCLGVKPDRVKLAAVVVLHAAVSRFDVRQKLSGGNLRAIQVLQHAYAKVARRQIRRQKRAAVRALEVDVRHVKVRRANRKRPDGGVFHHHVLGAAHDLSADEGRLRSEAAR
mmetsp:Transcript_19162/g.61314  ORF Transcript_19162/g.61314 Transcript_19162/m.61314 type:complete len:297 (-) Transcript_19162:134-1024(-)